ncbi:MAG: hypothetical protein ACFE8M_00650 [Candidatus Hermodarchaeota archaeon]
MNKRKKTIIFLYITLSTLALTSNLKAYYYNLISLETDRDNYYFDEFIEINASWELYYDINQEISYIQIQICDDSDDILWNSSKYYDMGINEKNWTIQIQNFNYFISNYSNTLFVNAYNYFKDLNVGNQQFTLLKSVAVNIYKRNVSCEIIGFKNSIKYGENLAFIAKFFCIENNSGLSNQTVEFKIMFKENLIYREDYLTNKSGIIMLYISSIDQLELGENSLIFNISNNKFFKDSHFEYKLNVERFPIFNQIIRFKSNITTGDDIIFEILFYYLNGTIHPLKNKTINLGIYSNDILKFEKNFGTNNSGLLKVNISYNAIEIAKNQDNILIILYFNGSKFFQNFTISLNVKLIRINSQDYQFKTEILVLSLTASSIIIFSIIIYNRKRSKSKFVKDISFRI